MGIIKNGEGIVRWSIIGPGILSILLAIMIGVFVTTRNEAKEELKELRTKTTKNIERLDEAKVDGAIFEISMEGVEDDIDEINQKMSEQSVEIKEMKELLIRVDQNTRR